MDHLSGMDAIFLHLEAPEVPMHVGSLMVLNLPEGHDDNFVEVVKRHIQERQHLAPLLTRKLVKMPFDLSDPAWVPDEHIDWDYHVRAITLPKPGSNTQLQALTARLHSSLLDRSRPLWELAVIDGLRSGQVAIYIKVHHSGMDGQAGVALGAALFDTTPQGRKIPKPLPKPAAQGDGVGMAELAASGLKHTAQQYVKLVKMLPDMARVAKSMLVPPRDADGQRDWSLPKNLQLLSPRTPLNKTITNQRAFAARTVPLAEMKYVAKAFGVTVNDVVMAATAGALRRYLKDLNALPEKSLTAGVPVSLREAGDGSANNQVSAVVIPLSTDEADPVKRLHKIRDASILSKGFMGRIKAVIPTDLPVLAAPWVISGLAAMTARAGLYDRLPPFSNVAISNVPGLQQQLYCAGAEVVCNYPVSIAFHGMALNVTVTSYNGRMDYGLIACRRTLPQIHELADFLLDEHRQLLAAAQALNEGAGPAVTRQSQTETRPSEARSDAAATAPRRRPPSKEAANGAASPVSTASVPRSRRSARPKAGKAAAVPAGASAAEAPSAEAAAAA
ncbi:wax ester/triacylglycerol synthase family O-acyltransferase [Curvibacter sp. HBC28]|uniref:diacylglycerol O-acyltransferase n=1 Tax=Curvibacter microcysteis TaxID=3026419 RepID=A0ABT5MKX6_9BURK|nr:wax ester/triacylglycerol synthase family O-acyltransferase [Curvibacter sp. HBC28]MDD0817041.1 wax ester/triacylglycerol synthase family O-acyltransferase [Curvibacter sp. HBC28]